jgi:prepilin-type N-terminal cleavage/methylation domain-containing protein
MEVRPRNGQAGFSLLEMMSATVILLIGLIAIAQLVPTSIQLNYRNRTDSSALVLVQRLLDQFLDQPLNATFFTDAPGTPCALGCSLGDPSLPNTVQGSQLVPGQALIDFSAAPLANFSLTFTNSSGVYDEHDVTYDVRWVVIIVGNGTTVSSKRFIIGVRQATLHANGYVLTLPLTAGKVLTPAPLRAGLSVMLRFDRHKQMFSDAPPCTPVLSVGPALLLLQCDCSY